MRGTCEEALSSLTCGKGRPWILIRGHLTHILEELLATSLESSRFDLGGDAYCLSASVDVQIGHLEGCAARLELRRQFGRVW
jgi:hypothetical protein